MIDRLDEIPGVGPVNAQIILAEIGLDMSQFPAAGHLVSWAKLWYSRDDPGCWSRRARMVCQVTMWPHQV